MADRKVLIKYYPKNFDPDLLVKRGRGKDKLMIVRNMLPMSLRCNTCANYLYIGTKFNMRMQICNEQTYLGIKVFRFYLKCTYCYSDITFKTDPKNHDYVVELGGTRNYEPIRDAQQAEKLIKKMAKDEKQGDSMKFLETRTYDSKRQMQINEALQDIKSLNKRQAVIDPEDLLKNMMYTEIQQTKFTEDEQIQIDRRFQQMQKQRYLELAKKYNINLPDQENQKGQIQIIKQENESISNEQQNLDLEQKKQKLQIDLQRQQSINQKVAFVPKILANSFKEKTSNYTIKYQTKVPKKKIIKKPECVNKPGNDNK